MIFSKIINPNNNNIIAAENPTLWLEVKKVTVLTNKGPKNDVNLPEVANKPNPFPWLFFLAMMLLLRDLQIVWGL